MILPSRSVSILFGTTANSGSAMSSAHRRTLNSCCSAKDLIAKNYRTRSIASQQTLKGLAVASRAMLKRLLGTINAVWNFAAGSSAVRPGGARVMVSCYKLGLFEYTLGNGDPAQTFLKRCDTLLDCFVREGRPIDPPMRTVYEQLKPLFTEPK